MAVLERTRHEPVQPLSSASEMYQAGYRARKTGKRTGEVCDPNGTVFRINTLRETCSCRLQTGIDAEKRCIHLKSYIGLRCEQNARACVETESGGEIGATSR